MCTCACVCMQVCARVFVSLHVLVRSGVLWMCSIHRITCQTSPCVQKRSTSPALSVFWRHVTAKRCAPLACFVLFCFGFFGLSRLLPKVVQSCCRGGFQMLENKISLGRGHNIHPFHTGSSPPPNVRFIIGAHFGVYEHDGRCMLVRYKIIRSRAKGMVLVFCAFCGAF